LDEKVIDVIPRVVTPGDITDEEYSLVITSRRTILVPVKSHSDLFADWFFGGIILAIIGDATARRKYIEDKNIDPETLTKIVDTVVIWHSSLGTAGIRKRLSSYHLELEYRGARSKSRSFSCKLAPPSEYLAHCKKMGTRRRDAVREYAAEARHAYEKALPKEFSPNTRWDV